MSISFKRLLASGVTPIVIALIVSGTLYIETLECDAQDYRVLQDTLALDSPDYIAVVRQAARSDKLSRWDYAMLMRAYWANSGGHTLAEPPQLENAERERKSFHAALGAVK